MPSWQPKNMKNRNCQKYQKFLKKMITECCHKTHHGIKWVREDTQGYGMHVWQKKPEKQRMYPPAVLKA